MISSTSPG
uniref:Uncharacterized protein n=1 Tax=Arundo donax TaxID=35708 RepID=A0A0A9HMV4_ARUDO